MSRQKKSAKEGGEGPLKIGWREVYGKCVKDKGIGAINPIGKHIEDNVWARDENLHRAVMRQQRGDKDDSNHGWGIYRHRVGSENMVQIQRKRIGMA
jgi:hypothetical protein